MATLLIMAFIGLALSAGILGAMSYVRAAQESTLTTHALTQAQMKAYTGVEMVRAYLQQLQTNSKLDGFLQQAVPIPLDMTGPGASNLIQASVTAVNSAAGTLSVEVLGITAPGTRGQSSSKLLANYQVDSGAGTEQCVGSPGASAVFRGDVEISGGKTSVTGKSGYQTMAVEGNIVLQQAATAMISGCAKGDITMSGGGIADNATLSSEGTISISAMSSPVNASLWAKTLNFGPNTGAGSFSLIQAGAYSANIVSPLAPGTVLGTTQLGGKLLTGTTPATVPWTTGTVVPPASGNVLLKLNGGATYLLDLSKVTVAASGDITNLSPGLTAISGSASFPTSLRFIATGIYGGKISLTNATVDKLWGHTVSIQGWSGRYTTLWANGDFDMVSGTIGALTGGGSFWATQAGLSYGTAYYSMPTLTNASAIAGKMYIGSGKTQIANNASGNANVSGMTLATSKTGTSPGLPGVPYCDTRSDAVNIDSLKSQANYVFEYVNGSPQLTIQNVKRSNGVSIDGVYPLRNPNASQLALLSELMTCGNSAVSYPNGNPGCLQMGSSWALQGVVKFNLAGILWFDRDITIDDTKVNLYISLLSKGNVILTANGHLNLVAPNFSTPAQICDGAFYPANLCKKVPPPSVFVSWTDAAGNASVGLPLANMAVLTEGGLSSLSGWNIYGNVKIGQAATTAGAASTIYGSMQVGVNVPSTTRLTEGGFHVKTSAVSDQQWYTPGGTCYKQPGGGGKVLLKGANLL